MHHRKLARRAISVYVLGSILCCTFFTTVHRLLLCGATRSDLLVFVPSAHLLDHSNPREPNNVKRHAQAAVSQYRYMRVPIMFEFTKVAWGRALPAHADDDLSAMGRKALNLVTKGADEVYDPSTEEGAKALGLKFPVPKLEDLGSVTSEDLLPLGALFIFALIWGVFVVPAVMDREDGSKTVYFGEKKEEDIAPEVAASVDETAKVMNVKRVNALDDTKTSKKRMTPKKKPSGFAKRKR